MLNATGLDAGPMGSFEPFSDVSKLIPTALMFLGRLEIIPNPLCLRPCRTGRPAAKQKR